MASYPPKVEELYVNCTVASPPWDRAKMIGWT